MSKYKVLKDNIKNVVAQEFEKTIPIITEEYEAKIRRQAAEITRLLAENERLKPKYENIRAKGQNEAWELARKILQGVHNGGYSPKELAQIFGCEVSKPCIVENTYQEATAKVAEWEKAKEEIKVGDVFQDDDGNNAIVTSIKGNTIYYMWDDGDTRSWFAEDVKKHFTKTGRHIDIDGFLKQIGEE